MTIYFSPSQYGFYDTDLFDYELPSDVVETTAEERDALLPQQSDTRQIVVGDDGKLAIKEVPQTVEQLTANALLQRDGLLRDAATRIAPLQDAVDLDMATAEETAALKAWKTYRVNLNRIEQQAGFPQSIAWPAPPSA